jgi:hypothetical protein
LVKITYRETRSPLKTRDDTSVIWRWTIFVQSINSLVNIVVVKTTVQNCARTCHLSEMMMSCKCFPHVNDQPVINVLHCGFNHYNVNKTINWLNEYCPTSNDRCIIPWKTLAWHHHFTKMARSGTKDRYFLLKCMYQAMKVGDHVLVC